MTSSNLKPCPFCGSADIDNVFNNVSEPQTYVKLCRGCGAMGPPGAIMTNEDTERWNMRAVGID